MTWLHCYPDDGSIVSCSTDQDFNESNASSTMKKHYVNIHTNMTIAEARSYKIPLEDQDGNILQKRQWKLDLNTFVPSEHQDKVTDRDQEVPLIHELESRRVVTEHGIEKHGANAGDIIKIVR